MENMISWFSILQSKLYALLQFLGEVLMTSDTGY